MFNKCLNAETMSPDFFLELNIFTMVDPLHLGFLKPIISFRRNEPKTKLFSLTYQSIFCFQLLVVCEYPRHYNIECLHQKICLPLWIWIALFVFQHFILGNIVHAPHNSHIVVLEPAEIIKLTNEPVSFSQLNENLKAWKND